MTEELVHISPNMLVPLRPPAGRLEAAYTAEAEEEEAFRRQTARDMKHLALGMAIAAFGMTCGWLLIYITR